MANVDVKWPNENEEFDTVATKDGENKPEGEQVNVNRENQENTDAVSEQETAPETPEAVEPEAETPEPEAETPADNPQQQVEPDNELSKVAPAAAATTAVAATTAKGKHHWGRLALETVLLLALVGLAVWGFGLKSQNDALKKENASLSSQVDSLNKNPAIVEQKKTAELVGKVSSLMELPKDETPQAALVSDADSLKKQYPFFSSTANGDQILFYYQSGKVIVYRPSTNKIVQTGPLSITQAAAPATTGTTRR